jgi:hypothetical protein
MKIKPSPTTIRRTLRVIAFAFATGIAFMGAGNVFGFSALESAGFGATGAVLGLISVLLFNFAAKDGVSDTEFETAINQAIQQVQSQTAKDEK